MTHETTWTKDTHSKFGLLSYSVLCTVYTFIRHKGETKKRNRTDIHKTEFTI